jgi:hypothetical protein
MDKATAIEIRRFRHIVLAALDALIRISSRSEKGGGASGAS